MATNHADQWKARLAVPNYPIGEAARYARVAPGTVRAWHSDANRSALTLPSREPRVALSYLQLIEVAVVAACREAGLSLKRIREAREYVAKQLKSEHPFAQYRFKTDGKELLMPYEQVIGEDGRGTLLSVNKKGQLAWDEIIGARLKEFDYDGELAVRWHLHDPIIIDPRISFGAPTLKGIPTWLLKERWQAGERPTETAVDLGLRPQDVKTALEFEGVDITAPQRDPWLN